MTLPVFYDNLWIENRVGIKRDRIRKICWHKEWEKGGKKMKYEIKGGEHSGSSLALMDAGETMITEKAL